MKHTPQSITEQNLFYTIPIYQRLFEWDPENITTLLEDLRKEFDSTEGTGDYYIGMLTSTKDRELVDGQQRFTVMMLLGCVMQHYAPEWRAFLIADNCARIDFTSRPFDSTYLRSLIEQMDDNGLEYKNLKMYSGVKAITDFMQSIPEDQRQSFASYVFQHLSFFTSDLPEGYSPRDLNKYFERMNTSGKNLEQHEILKVKLLSNLGAHVDKYMLLWNKLADVDTPLIRRRKDEKDDDLRGRKRRAFHSDIATIFAEKLINGLKEGTNEDAKAIGNIEPSTTAPKRERDVSYDSRSALKFPYLLLEVLYRKLNKDIKGKTIDEFFKPGNLLGTFEEFLPFNGANANKDDIKDFMERLVKARLALDICFVRPTEYGYLLDMNLPEDNDDLKQLLMFESMLYVSSSNYTNYRWFNWLMDEVDKQGLPNATHLYKSLRERCDKEFKLPKYEDLTYHSDNRYWFWRLDFYIWEHRKSIFAEDPQLLQIADNYIFKRNRSIEHIAPQTPQSDSNMKWDKTEQDAKLRDSFGNLVMISQGLNSALRNESYEVKRAHVQAYCNGSKSGSIESLKLLMAYKDYPNGWSRETIKKHGEKMYGFLEEEFA